jgi:DUF1009 family protein
MTAVDAHTPAADAGAAALAIICGGGALPYAVADAVAATGRRVVLFALRGWADPAEVARFPHHWIAVGQLGRFVRLARGEGCQDLVCIGSMVRPAISQIRLDITTLRVLPRLISGFRGGDDHLLSEIGRIFEAHGFRLLGAQDVAPQILVPAGVMGRIKPGDSDRDDIARGMSILAALSPFDVGQAVVVARRHCLAVEGIEGTDAMLSRIADLRITGRINATVRTGVLVKAPKTGQERRLDLPSIGPQTVENASHAGLAGIAVSAGGAIAADLGQLIALADRNGIFVVGVRDDGTFA